MALVINTNTSALNTQRQLSLSQGAMSQAMERLSSGRRINSAGDDAAGLAISNRMTSQVRGLNQAIRNANDGISMLQVAEGALAEGTAILQRMRELSVQSANGIYSNSDRATLDAEFLQLMRELDRIATQTSFNGQKLLDGEASNIALQVGATANETIEFGLTASTTAELGLEQGYRGLIGDELSIDSANGLLAADLSGRVSINNTTLSQIDAGTSVQELIDRINLSVNDVEASAVIQAKATLLGDGVLSESDTLTINLYDLDGGYQSFVLSNTTSMTNLAETITSKTGGRLQASLDENGYLTIQSDSVATMLFADSTGGSASGFETSGTLDEGITNIVNSLQNFWLGEAQDLLKTHLGLEFSNGDTMTLNLYTDAPSGTLASISSLPAGFDAVNGEFTQLRLNIDLADYASITVPDGVAAIGYTLERTILHEMVHAAMSVNIDITGDQGDGLSWTDNDPLPGWFTEGIAELLHGADDNLVRYYQGGLIDSEAKVLALFDEAKAHGSPSAGAYATAYLSTKMLNDVLLAFGSNMTALMSYLDADSDLGAAISTATGGALADLAAFETYVENNIWDYLNGNPIANIGGQAITSRLNVNLLGSATTEAATDTGSLFGSDYGNSARTALGTTSVMNADNTNSINTIDSSTLTFVVPDEFSGDFYTADARLVLKPSNGSEIQINRTALATDADLSNFGFTQIDTEGEVIGNSLSSGEQLAALGSGDLEINGVIVGAVADGEGLLTKIEAINSISDQTGVVASVTSYESFDYDYQITKEVISSANFSLTGDQVIGINGVGIQLYDGQGAIDVAQEINSFSAFHGATAYADAQGRLHIFSRASLNLGGTPVTNMSLAYPANQTEGSLKLNGAEVDLSDLSDLNAVVTDINSYTATTGVRAEVDSNGELQLKGSATISIGLGDTNGLKTLDTFGISFGLDGEEDLTDSNNNSRIGDEIYRLNARVALSSLDGDSIAIAVNSGGQIATGLLDINAFEAGAVTSVLSRQNVATQLAAQASIEVIDTALEQINSNLSEIGAVINRLDFSINNLSSISENASTARSRIMDADFAAESASLSRAQILQRASTSMLAQANAAPRLVMSLLN